MALSGPPISYLMLHVWRLSCITFVMKPFRGYVSITAAQVCSSTPATSIFQLGVDASMSVPQYAPEMSHSSNHITPCTKQRI